MGHVSRLFDDTRGNALMVFVLIMGVVLIGSLAMVHSGGGNQGSTPSANPSSDVDAIEEGISESVQSDGGDDHTIPKIPERFERLVGDAATNHPALADLSPAQQRSIKRSLGSIAALESEGGALTTITPSADKSFRGIHAFSVKPETRTITSGGARYDVIAAPFPTGKIVDDVSDTRSESITVVRETLPRQNAPLRVVATSGSETWTAEIWRTGQQVVVRTPETGAVAVSQQIVTIDFADKTVGGQNASIEFARDVDGPFSVRFENSGTAMGNFSIVAKEASASAVTKNLQTEDIYWDAAFNLSHEDRDTLYTTTIRVAVPVSTTTSPVVVNQYPVARMSITPPSPEVGELVQFQSQSGDPDGTISSVSWEFSPGPQQQGSDVTHRFGATGTVEVTLTVVDNDGAKDIARDTITIEEPNNNIGGGDGGGGGNGDTGPYFDVTIDGTNSAVNEGDTLTVNATVENTGNATDTQRVQLTIDETKVDSRSLELSSDESRAITLSWTPGTDDEGSHTAKVVSENDTDSESVTVYGDGPTVEFTITPDPVTVNEDATLEVEANDPEGRTYVVWIDYDGDGSYSYQGTVDSPYPSTYTEQRSWDSPGTYTLEVKLETTDGPTLYDQAEVTVEDPGGGDGGGGGNGPGDGGGGGDGGPPNVNSIEGPGAVSYYTGETSDNLDPNALDYNLDNGVQTLLCSDVDSVEWILETEDGSRSISKTTTCPWVTFYEGSGSGDGVMSLVGPTGGDQDLYLRVTAEKNGKTSTETKVVNVCKNGDVVNDGQSCDFSADYPPPGFSVDGPDTITTGDRSNRGPYTATLKRDGVWDMDTPDWNVPGGTFRPTPKTGNPSYVGILNDPGQSKNGEIIASATVTAGGDGSGQPETQEKSAKDSFLYDPAKGGCTSEAFAKIKYYSPRDPVVDEDVTISAESDGCVIEADWNLEGTTPDQTEKDAAFASWTTPGDYTVTLTITDPETDTKAKDSTVVNVAEAEGCSESVSASIDQVSTYSPVTGETVTFDASFNGCDATVTWNFEGTTPDVADDRYAEASWDKAELYKVTYKVTDVAGETASDFKWINVQEDNDCGNWC